MEDSNIMLSAAVPTAGAAQATGGGGGPGGACCCRRGALTIVSGLSQWSLQLLRASLV